MTSQMIGVLCYEFITFLCPLFNSYQLLNLLAIMYTANIFSQFLAYLCILLMVYIVRYKYVCVCVCVCIKEWLVFCLAYEDLYQRFSSGIFIALY